jgi:uncharacterized FlgJ-related protein
VPSLLAAENSEPLRFEFRSYTDIEVLFAERGYTPAAWAQGVREVPRLYLTNIPERWRSSTSREVTVQKKKALFFRLLGPLVLRANELILADRVWLEADSASDDSARLDALFETYRVRTRDFDELLRRVDAVPPSLAMAQAAEESGWGTSRFADLGNALFGQWTFGDGIAPLERREEKGKYSIAAFDSPLDSVRAYMRNINSHPAYADLRRVRADARASGSQASGFELARTLTKYSERGEDYVHSLHAIMRVNRLGPTDEASLEQGAATHLVPVGEHAD